MGMADWVPLAGSRAGDGSRVPNERMRPRVAVEGGVGRREAREGGVNDCEWCGLSGDGARGEDRDGGSEELPVSAMRGGDDDSGAIVTAGVREGDACDDLGELIVGPSFWMLGIYTQERVCSRPVQVVEDDSREHTGQPDPDKVSPRRLPVLVRLAKRASLTQLSEIAGRSIHLRKWNIKVNVGGQGPPVVRHLAHHAIAPVIKQGLVLAITLPT